MSVGDTSFSCRAAATLNVEINSRWTFKVVPAPTTNMLEKELRSLAQRFQGREICTTEIRTSKFSDYEFEYPLHSYSAILERLQAAPFHKCRLDTPPSWLVSRMLQETHNGRYLIPGEVTEDNIGQALVSLAQFIDEWPLLVVGPAPQLDLWRDQSRRWLPNILEHDQDVQVVTSRKVSTSSRAKLVLVSYDLLVKYASYQIRADSQPYRAVVVSNSSQIKHWESQRSRTVLKICSDAQRCVLISDTPAVSRPQDFYAQILAIQPGINRKEFFERYCSGASRHLELMSFLTLPEIGHGVQQAGEREHASKRRRIS